jgi:hypothetical protein
LYYESAVEFILNHCKQLLVSCSEQIN